MTNAQPFMQPPQIWAIASGKGGVGKSFIAANLGMALAQQNKKVVLVDLDLGSANIHTCLGVNSPKTTLSDLLSQGSDDINQLITYHGHPSIGLISGAADSLEMANLKHFQKLKIMRNLSLIHADFVILDLGAGTSFNTLDFFLYADQALLTVTPEPTSIENSYRFIKCLIARQLKDLPKLTKKVMTHVLTQGKSKEGKPQSFSDFLADIQTQFPKHEQSIRHELKKLRLNLIVNQVLDTSDTKLGVSMAIIMQKYFALDLTFLGYLYHDMEVVHSLRQKQAYYHKNLQSRNVTSLNRIAAQLITELMHHKHKISMDAHP